MYRLIIQKKKSSLEKSRITRNKYLARRFDKSQQHALRGEKKKERKKKRVKKKKKRERKKGKRVLFAIKMIEKRAYIFVCHIPGKNPTPYTAPLLSPPLFPSPSPSPVFGQRCLHTVDRSRPLIRRRPQWPVRRRLSLPL